MGIAIFVSLAIGALLYFVMRKNDEEDVVIEIMGEEISINGETCFRDKPVEDPEFTNFYSEPKILNSSNDFISLYLECERIVESNRPDSFQESIFRDVLLNYFLMSNKDLKLETLEEFENSELKDEYNDDPLVAAEHLFNIGKFVRTCVKSGLFDISANKKRIFLKKNFTTKEAIEGLWPLAEHYYHKFNNHYKKQRANSGLIETTMEQFFIQRFPHKDESEAKFTRKILKS